MVDEYNYATVTLTNGSVYSGKSWGIEPAENDEGDYLGFYYVVFKVPGIANVLCLRNEDIVSVDKYEPKIKGNL